MDFSIYMILLAPIRPLESVPNLSGRRRLERKMEYRLLGRSGLRVSVVTLGTMTFGGVGKFSNVGSTDVAGARRQIDIALDAGVNMIDTANVYSAGVCEEIIGEALSDGRRQRMLVATKCRMRIGPNPNDAGASRSTSSPNARRACVACGPT
jgi:aryl-alcohol dehydrogenase-like predicted oxidoreductase